MTTNKKLILDDVSFEIVDVFPLGYQIWLIGKNMTNGYLPLCRLSSHQKFEGGKDIEIDTLKAIKVEGAEQIMNASHIIDYVTKSIYNKSMIFKIEKYIEKHKNAKKGTVAYYDVQRLIAALPYLKQIKFD